MPEPGLLKEPGALAALLADRGAGPGTEVVVYCRTGVQASYLYFVARTAGLAPRLYDASFIDWSRRAELPVEAP
jgi:thiosulfate/3-mercaptopyruvate sulfurtransferase